MGELSSDPRYAGYISSREAGTRFRVTNDYIARLCRRGKVRGVFIGKVWFVEEKSLRDFLTASAARRKTRSELLSGSRKAEYGREQTRETKVSRRHLQAIPAPFSYAEQALAGETLTEVKESEDIRVAISAPPVRRKSVRKILARAAVSVVAVACFLALAGTALTHTAVSNSDLAALWPGFDTQMLAPLTQGAHLFDQVIGRLGELLSGRTVELAQQPSAGAPARQAPALGSATSSPSASTVAVRSGYTNRPVYVTYPVIERTVVRSGVTQNLLTEQLQELKNALLSQIAQISVPASPAASGGIANEVSATQVINRLTDVAITDPIVSGGSFSDFSGSGTFSGSFSGSSTLSSLTVSGTSTAGDVLAAIVGIGTTSPFALFSAAGTANGTTPLFALSTSTANATSTAVEIDQNGNLFLNNGASATIAGSLTAGTTTVNSLSVTNVSTSTLAGGLTVDGSGLVVQQSTGNVGIGTTSPYATLSVMGNNGSTNSTLFAIGSSTASATSTLFSVSNTGVINVANSIAFSIGGGTISSYSNGYIVIPSLNIENGILNDVGGIQSAANGTGALIFEGGNGTEQARFAAGTGYFGIGTTSPWAQLSVNPNGITGPAFAIGSSTASDFVVTNGGNVGIGTTTPGSLLSVAGNSYTSGFINTSGTTGGYQIDGNTVLQASSTNFSLLVGGAGLSLTATSLDNLAIGSGALASATSTINNTIAIGEDALHSLSNDTNQSANDNLAVGNYALENANDTAENLAIGNYAGASLTTGSANTLVGTGNGVAAGFHLTTGSSNVLVGYGSGSAITSGSYNITVGQSLWSDTAGSYNVAIGAGSSGASGALGRNTSPNYTVAIGENAGLGNSLYSNQGGTYIGFDSGFNLANLSDYNTLLGYQSGDNVTSGADNILIGPDTTGSYDNLTTGSQNIALGYNVSLPSPTASGQLDIGNLIYGTGLNGTGSTVSTGNVGIGTTSPYATLSVMGNNGSTDSTLFAIGSSTASATSTLFDVLNTGSVGIGTTTPGSLLSVAGNSYTSGFINTSGTTGGYQIDGNAVLQASSTLDSLFVGSGGSTAQTGGSDVGVGLSALSGLTTGQDNTGIGSLSLQYATSSSDNVAIGYRSLQNDIYGGNDPGHGGYFGNDNVGIGTTALVNNTYGHDNIGIGSSALSALTTGMFNISIGSGALASDNSGENLIAIGYQALRATTAGYSDIAIGDQAGSKLTTGGSDTLFGASSGCCGTIEGDGNVAAGLNLTTGGDDTFIGTGAGASMTTGSNNTVLGALSMVDNTTGNNDTVIGGQALWYDTSATSTTAVGYLAGQGDNLLYHNQGGVLLGYESGIRSQTGSDYNTLLGYQSGDNVTSGADNILIGPDTTGSYDNLTTGSQNIALGYNVSLPSPTASGQLDIGNLIYGTGLNGTGSTVSTGNVGIGTTSPWAQLSINPNGITGPAFAIGSSTASDFVVTDGGNVGVGTTSPMTLLSVQGSGFNTGYGLAQGYFSNSGTETGIALANTGTGGRTYDIFSTDNASGVPGGSFVIGDVTGTAARFVISSAGDIGIGTTSPSSTLTVTGAGCFSQGAGVATVACGNAPGNLYYKAANTGNYDVAENYVTSDPSLTPGTVVALDTTAPDTVTIATEGSTVLGVVSTAPGMTLGGADAANAGQNVRPIALSGRVPVRVSLEGGPISIGDPLELSSTPGLAMKATHTGETIGLALEDYSGNATGTVMTFINRSYYIAPSDVAITGTGGSVGTTSPSYTLNVNGAAAADGFAIHLPSMASSSVLALSQSDEDAALAALASTTISKWGAASSTPDLHIGIFAQNLPAAALDANGNIDLYALQSLTIAAIKSQERKIEALQGQVAALGAVSASVDQLTSALASLGATIASGAWHFAQVTADALTTQYLVADNAAAQNITVGSAQAPSGITLFDTVTKQPYCFMIAGGAPTTTPGACAQTATSSYPFSGGTSTAAASTTTSGAPVLSVNGNNPAQIAVGSTYSDLGATITGPSADLNLGVSATVDGGATTTPGQIIIDTSVTGTHTIEYFAIDQNGLMGTATRTVVVYDPNATSTSSTSATTTSTTTTSTTTSTSTSTSTATTTTAS